MAALTCTNGHPMPEGTLMCPKCGATGTRTENRPGATSRARRPDLPDRVADAPAATINVDADYILGLPAGVEIPLVPGQAILLGRASPDVRVGAAINDDTFPGVSREHAVVRYTGKEVTVTQVAETPNGTWVDGKEIPTGTPVPLRPGSSLRLGMSCEITLTEVEHDGEGD